jgi:hypothetical protein
MTIVPRIVNEVKGEDPADGAYVYRPGNPPQDCGARYVLVVTRPDGSVLGQAPFEIAC